eukprot:9920703-Heterocapsa_arctica.AAC.1
MYIHIPTRCPFESCERGGARGERGLGLGIFGRGADQEASDGTFRLAAGRPPGWLALVCRARLRS